MDERRQLWARELLRIVGEAATEELAAEHATLRETDCPDETWPRRLELRPRNPRSARLRLCPGDGKRWRPGLDILEAGKHGFAELYQSLKKRRELVHVLVRAVVDGRYTETVWYGPEGTKVRVFTTFHIEEKPWEYQVCSGVGRDSELRKVVYEFEPYKGMKRPS